MAILLRNQPKNCWFTQIAEKCLFIANLRLFNIAIIKILGYLGISNNPD